MNEKDPKKQIVSKIKDATNILVTVSRNPSVDELSAALALTFMLDKMGKHATAVFSGEIPPAINFLEPEKTFEDSTSSLRDFIISLDKEKADRLRYKVDGDLVKIFITPYKTTITEKDLDFSEGDFNVELAIAIGVNKKDELDEAIASHGRILHDATVATINMTGGATLGTITWTDASASSYSEIIANLGEPLQENLLDEQIATALLTGIVSATDQFRNEKTTPQVMTLSANLMAAGANQQLIATKLSEEVEAPIRKPVETKVDPTEKDQPTEKKKDLGEMSIDHDEPSSDEPTEKTINDTEIDKNRDEKSGGDDALAAAEAQLSAAMEKATPADTDIKADLEAATNESNLPPIAPIEGRNPEEKMTTEPSFDASLNATTAKAAAEKAGELDSDRNKPILSHGGSQYLPGADPNQPAQGADTSEPPSVNPFAKTAASSDTPPHTTIAPLETTLDEATAPEPETPAAVSEPKLPAPSLDDLTSHALSQAQSANDQTLQSEPGLTKPADATTVTPPAFDNLPPAEPANFGFPDLPAPPPVPDFSAGTPPSLPPEFGPTPTPSNQPPIPEFNEQGMPVGFAPETTSAAPANPAFPNPEPSDPGQFQIPS